MTDRPPPPGQPASLKFVAVILLLILGGALWLIFSPTRTPAKKVLPKPTSEVAIQDGKTIDFSSGRPVVKGSAEEKALIARSVQEMEDAAKEVTFAPPQKKPAPTPAPK